ncbi:hypothetical protein [Helicobacter labacensis]|uniref:hypothetical protein n=1 Tax=Helicobacter labacensis TaxID=2316079 RepID=UPI0013CE352E|nr:hypothetical protein [Helicobacter labacensis]
MGVVETKLNLLLRKFINLRNNPNLNKMSYRELSKLYDKNLKAELQLEAKLAKAQKEVKNLEDKLEIAGDNLVKIAKAWR